jgi:hypothetical protein
MNMAIHVHIHILRIWSLFLYLYSTNIRKYEYEFIEYSCIPGDTCYDTSVLVTQRGHESTYT